MSHQPKKTSTRGLRRHGKLSISYRSYGSETWPNKIKHSFFKAAVVSILLYGCTTWTLTKRLEKKINRNYSRMMRAILHKSWRQHPTKHQLYGHLPLIKNTIQVRWTRHAGHCWRSKDELINDILQWTSSYGWAKAGRPARTYIQQLCEDTGCSPEALPEAMNDREKWRERVRDIRAGGTTWWWWCWKDNGERKWGKFDIPPWNVENRTIAGEDQTIIQILLMFFFFSTIFLYENSPPAWGGARGVMVIVVGNGHGDTSSNPGRDWWHFT